MKPSIYETIALSNPRGATSLLSQYGYPQAYSYEELVSNLKHCAKQNGQEFLLQLGNIHPDKDLILAGQQPAQPEEKSGACGCSSSMCGEAKHGCAGDPTCSCGCSKTSSADGSQDNTQTVVQKVETFNSKMQEYMPTLQLLNLALLGAILYKMSKK